VQLRSVSESAIMLYLGDTASAEISACVQASTIAIEQALAEDLVDLVPSYASVLILYNPLRTDHVSVMQRVRAAVETLPMVSDETGHTVVLPVYYAPEAGADLEALAERTGLSTQEVISLHCAIDYRVYAIGFAPGFAYLGQVDERIATPRLASPRAVVPRGSVAIADRQTAVYPAASPGGWNLIGRCPTAMFDPLAEPCMPVSVGDRGRFESISREQFLDLNGDLS
jgi:KipI family sensor histidine kinase inhibitor